MKEKKFIFICGLHRSGTSLLYKILKEQKNISGLTDTNVIEDEGQHIQSVYPPAKLFGGPGKFGFDSNSFLNERSSLISDINREKLFNEWSQFWNLNCDFLLEKSPPNLVRTLFLQEMFPNAHFIILTRHPIATSLATKKWSKTSYHSLINHWLICHQEYKKCAPRLKKNILIRYEDLVMNPEMITKRLSIFLGTNVKVKNEKIRTSINNKYFSIWKRKSNNIFLRRQFNRILKDFEISVNQFNYSLIINTND